VAQIRIAQVCLAQIDAAQVRARKVGSLNTVLLAILVPALRALPQMLN
jgi:hypothetical protein